MTFYMLTTTEPRNMRCTGRASVRWLTTRG